MREVANTAVNLRRLLWKLYAAGLVANDGDPRLSDAELVEVLDVVVDAAEGRPFAVLELPQPRLRANDA
jgi:hypothetical protein